MNFYPLALIFPAISTTTAEEINSPRRKIFPASGQVLSCSIICPSGRQRDKRVTSVDAALFTHKTHTWNAD